MKYICRNCGEPTDNDQSFDVQLGMETYHCDVHRCDQCDKRFHNDTYSFDEGDTTEVECDFCGKKFDLRVETRRVFSTKRSLCEMPENYGEEDEEE